MYILMAPQMRDSEVAVQLQVISYLQSPYLKRATWIRGRYELADGPLQWNL
jgi:hypothetical protein